MRHSGPRGKIMWLEGYCFVAGMGAVLIVLPVLGLWGNEGKRGNKMQNNKKNMICLRIRPGNPYFSLRFP